MHSMTTNGIGNMNNKNSIARKMWHDKTNHASSIQIIILSCFSVGAFFFIMFPVNKIKEWIFRKHGFTIYSCWSDFPEDSSKTSNE